MKLIKVDNTYNIELNDKEARAIVASLGRTMSKGETLDISMELEDKLNTLIQK